MIFLYIKGSAKCRSLYLFQLFCTKWLLINLGLREDFGNLSEVEHRLLQLVTASSKALRKFVK